ncbi:hypothetical protein ACFSTI_26085 [Rhizorhabdus histidinilytica]
MPPGLSVSGLALTRRVRHSWCMGRVRRAAPLTLAILTEDDREEIVAEWVARGGGTSSFFETEAEAFLTFVSRRLDRPSHASSLCRFERAVIRARGASTMRRLIRPASIDSMVQRSPHADLVELHAPVEQLLEALAKTRRWPAICEGSHRLLVAPGIAGLVRDASPVEIALWHAAERPVPAKDYWPAARSLVACGALETVAGVDGC